MRRHPIAYYALLFGGVTVPATIALALFAPAFWWIAWLSVISIVTLIAFRYDKAIAGSNQTRVPEAVLLGLVALGGTIGGALGMWAFRKRHKTDKFSFRVKFFAIVVVQILLIVIYVWNRFQG